MGIFGDGKCTNGKPHNFRNPKSMGPGTSQVVCTRCGRVKNMKCGTLFNPHRMKRDRRYKNKRLLKCTKCGFTQVV